jgi:hypothetical protein
VERLARLDAYGAPELGTVTGANGYFVISEETRVRYEINPRHLKRICPPGTKHLRGLSFTRGDWEELRLGGERVWLFYPVGNGTAPQGVREYIEHGEAEDINLAYKCSVRVPWWRPPVVAAPDLYFTYMSYLYPRLITNAAGYGFLNSMHGIRLRPDVPPEAKEALPLLCLNSATMLGAEVFGRSYGGGILKMEPREAAMLPVPKAEDLSRAWGVLRHERARASDRLRRGDWETVRERVDSVLLANVLGLQPQPIEALRQGADFMRHRRNRSPKT